MHPLAARLLDLVSKLLIDLALSFERWLHRARCKPREPYLLRVRSGPTKPPPVFYINMDKDADRRARVERDLNRVFGGWTDVTRVRGLADGRGGRRGCRLAHMKAHGAALATARGEDGYYIIAEDDVRPLRCPETIRAYVSIAMRADADMMMLEHGGGGEAKAALQPIVDYDGRRLREFYRYHSTVHGFGMACMLVRASFGRRLLRLWQKYTDEHCDVTAFRIMPSHRILMPNPQLFAQREYPSSQTNVNVRPNQRPFDFVSWQYHHGDLPETDEESV